MKLSNVLSLSFQLFKTTFLTHLLGCLLLFGVLLGLYWFLAPVIFGMPLEEVAQLSKQPEKIAALVNNGGFAIKLSLFLLLVDGIVTPFTTGMYKNYRLVQRNEAATIGQLFSFYRSTYTGRILSYVLLLTALKSVAFVGIGALGLPAFALATVTVMSIVFVLTLPIIIFEDQPLLRAMGNSYKRTVPVIFTVMLALILGGIVSLLGAFVFGIGIVVTFPMLYAVIYSLYTNSVTH